MVMDKGGAGINTQLVLGKNVRGTEKMILPPMSPAEKLWQVPNGKRKSYMTVAQYAATQLTRMDSPNDVSRKESALFADGNRRPAMPDTPFKKCDPLFFFDNIMVVSKTRDSSRIHDFFKIFGLTKSGKPEIWQRISVAARNKDKQGRFPLKIATANIPVEDIKFIIMVYNFATTWDEDAAILQRWRHEKCCHHMVRLKMTTTCLLLAVTMVFEKEVTFLDVDFTMDLPGTLHAQELTDNIRNAGYIVNQASKCGNQCVKFAGRPGEGHKIYNKVLSIEENE